MWFILLLNLEKRPRLLYLKLFWGETLPPAKWAPMEFREPKLFTQVFHEA